MSYESYIGISGKTAVVTASGRGVGRAVALMLAGAGADVVINYFDNAHAAEEVVTELKAEGVRSLAVRADVSVESDAARLVKEAEAELGPIDILVNCAHGEITRAAFEDATWEAHARQYEGALGGAFHVTKAVVYGMKARGWGRIVNVGSAMVGEPVEGYSAHTSAMAALIGFTRNLAVELGPYGVTVNMVSPGFVVTGDMPNTTEWVRRTIAETTPLGRLGTPQDMAGAVLFFCSGLAGFITGAELVVDGGRTMT